MNRQEYWKKRETEAKKHNIQDEEEYSRQIQEIYGNMMDEINKEINGFYTRYAKKEKITMAEAKRRADRLDIKAYERKAKKYVATKDFSDQANEEMRIYNLTMKVNRLELLKANIGLEMVSGFDEMQKYFDKKLSERTIKEFRRQAGILGASVMENGKMVHAIVNASFKNATYSERIWGHQGMLKADIQGLLVSGLVGGKNPKVLARHLEKRFGVSRSNAERLMITELARVQTEAQKQSFIRNGFEEYEYVACSKTDICSICQALDGKHFKIEDMMPGTNAPPMHPRCHCSVAAYMDDEAYEEWINSYKKHGLNFEDWKRLKNGEKEESKPKYQYPDTVVNKKMLKSSQYRRKFENVSEDTKLNRTAWKVSQRMLEHRSGSRYEDLAFIDSISGKSIVNESYDAESKAKPSKAMLKMLKDADHGTIIAIHNHPGSSVPSIPDLRVYIQRGYKKGIIVCHDGKVYIYSIDVEKYNEPIAASALDWLEIEGYTEEIKRSLAEAGVNLEVF